MLTWLTSRIMKLAICSRQVLFSEDRTRPFRGLTILNVEPERARLLKEQDPAVPCRAVLGQSITLDDATGRDALFSHALPPLDDGGRFRLNNSYRRLGQM